MPAQISRFGRSSSGDNVSDTFPAPTSNENTSRSVFCSITPKALTAFPADTYSSVALAKVSP